MDFTHLRVHSDYTLLESSSSLSSLIEQAQNLNMSTLALTDKNNLFGALSFYQKAKQNNIKPIIGLQLTCYYDIAVDPIHKKWFDLLDNFDLVLLAKNEKGYHQLVHLCSWAYLNTSKDYPSCSWSELVQHSQDVYILSGGDNSPWIQHQKQSPSFDDQYLAHLYQEAFGDRFYLELQNHFLPHQEKQNRFLAEIAEKHKLPLVVSNDTYYTLAEHAHAHEVLLCIGNNEKTSDPDHQKMPCDQYYLKSAEQMQEAFKDYPEALENTQKLAQSIQIDIHFPGPQMPIFQTPKEYEDHFEYLKTLCEKGLAQRYANITEKLQTRLTTELDVIHQLGFVDYFLIVWDLIDFAKNQNIPVGLGRGSGAGCLAAYCLKITDVDPLKYDLLFERFLNPDRVSLPDFDIDFCYERRSEIIHYVSEKYGTTKVAQIITFGTLKPKAVIKDVSRVLDISFEQANAMTKFIPSDLKNLEQMVSYKNEKWQNYYQTHKQAFDIALVLQGLNRHISTHAAGVVIGRKALENYVPVYKDAQTQALSTQYTMNFLEQCGLIKMDFLGLKTLTLIHETEKLIRKNQADFDIQNICETDEKTYQMLCKGLSTGVFQFESSGMQNILKQAQPQSIEDLIALNALYRPGPMRLIPQYIDSKLGRQAIQYPHPDLKPILESTYGVIVYQEQVMQVAQLMAGFSLAKADILRRVMGKKKKQEMDKMQKEFIQGCEQKGYGAQLGQEIFQLLQPFADYGFNKSHAAAYAILGYRTAFLKANYPAEFMAATLTNETVNPDNVAKYIQEAQSMGLTILPPDVNLSELHFSVRDDQTILYGLLAIKNIGTAAASQMVNQRIHNGPFENWFDFVDRMDKRVMNKKTLESAILSGVFDSFHYNRATLLKDSQSLDTMSQETKNQFDLFNSAEQDPQQGNSSYRQWELEIVEEYPRSHLAQKELELLHYYAHWHPLEEVKPSWSVWTTLNLQQVTQAIQQKKYQVLGLLSNVKKIKTKNNAWMAFARLEDFLGSIELTFFPKTYEKYSSLLNNGEILAFSGKLDRSRGTEQLLVDHVVVPSDVNIPEALHLWISLSENTRGDFWKDFHSILSKNKGNALVFLHCYYQGESTIFRCEQSVKIHNLQHWKTLFENKAHIEKILIQKWAQLLDWNKLEVQSEGVLL